MDEPVATQAQIDALFEMILALQARVVELENKLGLNQ